MARYQIYRAPGWHGQPTDPVIEETDDALAAAMRAGCRVDIGMPGQCNRHDAYAIDTATGERVEPIESYCCDACGDLIEWGDGPIGAMNGQILGCPEAAEKHLLCHDCAEAYQNP